MIVRWHLIINGKDIHYRLFLSAVTRPTIAMGIWILTRSETFTGCYYVIKTKEALNKGYQIIKIY